MKRMNVMVLTFMMFLGCNINCGSSCGYTSRDSEVIGQVKKVQRNTPLFCDDYDEVDVSLGVMRGGVGSYSTEDIWMFVTPAQAKELSALQKTNAVVKFTYDDRRWVNCVRTDRVVRGFVDVSDSADAGQ